MSTNSPTQRGTFHWALVLFAMLAMVALALTGCKKDEALPPSLPPVGLATGSTRLLGDVVDVNGAPLAGVTVSSGGSTTTTNAQGLFFFGGVPTGARCVVRCVQSGYFPAVLGTVARLNGTTRVSVVMMSAAPTFTGLSSAITHDLTLPDGARVAMPANDLVDGSGSAYSGNYSMAVVHLDPTEPGFQLSVPGGDLAATDAGGNARQLYSYGMLMVRITDNGGNELQLASGATATIELPVASVQLGSSPTTIPLWHLNEVSGLWEEEGSAMLQSGVYVGSVSHFSTWNVDLPVEPSEVIGTVVDGDGTPIEGIRVILGQVSAVTASDGRFMAEVPSGLSFDMRVGINPLGLPSSPVTISPLAPGEIRSVPDIILPVPAYLEGTVMCNGNVNGYATAMWSSGSFSVGLSAAGSFRVPVPANAEVGSLRLFNAASGMTVSIAVTFPSAPGLVTQVGAHALCGTPPPAGFQAGFTLTGDGNTGTSYILQSTAQMAIATHYMSDDNTLGYFLDGNGGGQVVLDWPGSSTGNFLLDEDSEGSLSIMINGYVYVFRAIGLQITQYGAVGSDILGLFSGTAVRVDPVTFEDIEVTITNGYFRLRRAPDEP